MTDERNPYEKLMAKQRRGDRIAALLAPAWVVGTFAALFVGQRLLGADGFHTFAKWLGAGLCFIGLMIAAFNFIKAGNLEGDVTERIWEGWRERLVDDGKEFKEAVVINASEIRAFAKSTIYAWSILGACFLAVVFWLGVGG